MIVCAVDYWLAGEFFLRVAQAQPGRFLILTNTWSIHRAARRRGVASLLVSAADRADVALDRDAMGRVLASIECRSGAATPRIGARYFAAVHGRLSRLVREQAVSALWCWNGSDLAGAALRSVAAGQGIATAFFEIANVDRRLFVDPLGVNAQSSLMSMPRQLDGYAVALEEFRAWRERYMDTRRADEAVPQARTHTALRWACVADELAATARGTRSRGWRRLAGRFLEKAVPTRRRHGADRPRGDYLFLPLQLGSDSQVLINSEVGNEEAVRIAHELAVREGLNLVVKFHPAETDRAQTRRILRFAREHRVQVSSGNTFRLLEGSARVVTINSTVGFEALLLGRPVMFLGRTFYRHLDTEQRLANYVLGFLRPLDFFGRGPLDPDQVDRLPGVREGVA